MNRAYSTNIRPHVERELIAARDARKSGAPADEFHHLENAHVLGQESTYWHTKVHVLMLQWAIRNRSLSEMIGQVIRIIGAATKTAIGLVPEGNTGGSNVSPLRRMPVAFELRQIIEVARVGK